MKEMVGGCCVCSDERGWNENPLVYCDGTGCNVAVHQACYGIIQVPSGPWFCRKCESQERAARVRCDLCPQKEGALKRTDTGSWSHVVCALFVPEAWFGNVQTMEPIILKGVPPERYNKTCYICEESGREGRASSGACMQCNKNGCKQAFHVTCAQSAGLLCEEQGSYVDNVKYCGYCEYHYKKLKKDSGHIKTIPAFKPIISPDLQSPESTPEKAPPSTVSKLERSQKKPISKFWQFSRVTEGDASNPRDRRKGKAESKQRPAHVPAPTGTAAGGATPTSSSSAKDKTDTEPNLGSPASNASTAARTPESTISSKFTTANFTETTITPSPANLGELSDSKKDSSSSKKGGERTHNPASKSQDDSSDSGSGSDSDSSDSDNDDKDDKDKTDSADSGSDTEKGVLMTRPKYSSSLSSSSSTQSALSSSSSSLNSTSSNTKDSKEKDTKIDDSKVLKEHDAHAPPKTSYALDSFLKSKYEEPPVPRVPRERAPEKEAPTQPAAKRPRPSRSAEKPEKKKVKKQGRPPLNKGKTALKDDMDLEDDEAPPPVSARSKAAQAAKEATSPARATASPPLSPTATKKPVAKKTKREPPAAASGAPTLAPAKLPSTLPVSLPAVPKQDPDEEPIDSPPSSPPIIEKSMRTRGRAPVSYSDSPILQPEVGEPGGAAGDAVPGHASPPPGTTHVSLVLPPRPAAAAKPQQGAGSPPSIKSSSLLGGGGDAGASLPTSMEQLLERQWEQGSAFLMEQGQHFDIASLLNCLHQLRQENQRLEEHINALTQRRDHLLAVNARLSLSLQPVTAPAGQTPVPGAPNVANSHGPSSDNNRRINNFLPPDGASGAAQEQSNATSRSASGRSPGHAPAVYPVANNTAQHNPAGSQQGATTAATTAAAGNVAAAQQLTEQQRAQLHQQLLVNPQISQMVHAQQALQQQAAAHQALQQAAASTASRTATSTAAPATTTPTPAAAVKSNPDKPKEKT